jgi:hypothetical protein
VDDRRLAEAAMYLRNAAPDQYLRFVEEFAAVATGSAFVLISSKADSIMSDQGWAKAAQFFLRTIKDCDSRVAASKKPTAEAPSR